MAEQPTKRRRRRVRWRAILGALALVLALACIGGIFIGGRTFVQRGASPPALQPQVVTVERRPLTETVQVNGALEPRDQASLSFAVGSRVREVLVQEGAAVREGQVLARLETRDLELKVASSKAQLAQAEQALAKLQAGPSEAELAAAAAAVARARADIATARQAVRPADVDNARQQLALARQRLAEMEAGTPPDELSAAEQQLLSAQDALTASEVALDRARDSASRAKTDAQRAMLDGTTNVEKAQRAYSDAYWDWDYVQRTGRHPTQKTADPETGREVAVRLTEREQEEFRRALDDATTALEQAQTQLQTLTLAYEAAREEEVRTVQESERALEASRRAAAEAERAAARQRTGGVASALLAARKEVADSEKAYLELTENPDRPASAAEREAALLDAIAKREKLESGPDPAELADARTKLEQARADVAQAEADLDDAALRAPIAGTVVKNTLRAGTAAVADDAVTVADLSGFLIRGTISEGDVVAVTRGLTVTITVDSVPGEAFVGRLERVSELPAESGQGADPNIGGVPGGALGGTYPVEIHLDADDDRLRVGMACTGQIQIFTLPDALVVPLQAVQTGPDGASSVLRVSGPPAQGEGAPATTAVPVTLGRSSGDSVQVLSGLQEGDQVLLQQLPPLEGPGAFGR
jgi:multidrug efflux pump subunit AcrA (membrane-fusion protein)